MRSPITDLSESGWLEEDALSRRLETIARLPDLAAPPVCLPDVHLKRGMEAPSSFAAATSGAIVPGLSSCSLNCGMGAIKTTLRADEVTPRLARDVFDTFRRSASASDWDLSDEDVLNVASRGFPAVLRKFGYDQSSTRFVENGGTLGAPLPSTAVMDIVARTPPSTLNSWRTRLGLGIGGNHFVEIQRISRIHDPTTAAAWGMSEGQIIVMYHGGGGQMAGFVGRYFGNRTKDRAKKRARLFVRKLHYHFGASAALPQFPSRLRYFSPSRFVRHPDGTPEGRRLLASIAIGMNYGYAYRLAIASRIAWSLDAVQAEHRAPELVYDLSHNSIQPELLNGSTVWVHRHNACKLDAGVPLVLPGTNNSASFIAVAGRGSEQYLRSAPHGLGELISRDKATGRLRPESGETWRFDGHSSEFTSVPHIRSPRMESAIERMEDTQLVRRVVELSPMAVLKDFRG